MPRSARRVLVLLPALLVALPPAPAAAQGLETGFEELVEVSEVALDVLVTDAAGTALEGLGPADFEVLEDGRPVTLTSVSFAASRRSRSSSS